MTTSTPVTKQRLPAIDLFRGMTILAMLVVNEIHALHGTPAWLKHVAANQDGMSFADLIFPAFLFITGLAIPASGKAELRRSHFVTIIQRSAALIVLGLFMVNAEAGFQAEAMLISPQLWAILSLLGCYLIWGAWPASPANYRTMLRALGIASLLILACLYQDGSGKISAMQTQWWGILGLIGWAYLLCASLYTLTRQRPILFILLQLALLVLLALEGPASLLPLKPHMSHSLIMLAGIMTYEILHGIWTIRFGSAQADKSTPTPTFLILLLLAVFYFAAAKLAHAYFPYSKIAATLPWIFASSGFCCVAYALVHACCLHSYWHQRCSWLLRAAQNALLCYTLPYLLYPALQLLGWHYPWLAADFYSGSLMIAVYALLLMGLAAYAHQRGIRWQI